MVIKKKIISLVLIYSFINLIVGLGIGYFWVNNLLKKNIIEENFISAQLLSSAISRIINEELEDTKAYISGLNSLAILRAINFSYQDMSFNQINNYFKDKDNVWLNITPQDNIFKEYLNNPISNSLLEILKVESRVVEIFITDKYGGLVASSNKTSDFYQADELWWQKAYNNGIGDDYIGAVELDESSGQISIPIAFPIKENTGEIVGIAKALINISRLFYALNEFKIGKTGYAILTNEEGAIIFYPNILPMTKKLLNSQLFNDLIHGDKHWIITKPEYNPQKEMLLAFVKIESLILLKNKVDFYVFVGRETEDVFKPLKEFMFCLLVIFIILSIFLILSGYFIGAIFVKPIQTLHQATERIINGDWNYRIKVNATDEIGQFAQAFSKMLNQLKNKQDELENTKNKLEELHKNLEDKVVDRTKQLNKINEATLNILEDLTEAKHQLEDALRIKSEFTSLVSHELRTPLSPIMEGIRIVTDGLCGPINPEQKKFLDMAQRNVSRLARFVNNVLDFQKLSSGKITFHITQAQITEVVKEVYQTMELVVKDKGIDFILEIEDNIPKIFFDRDKIIQVLTNLINNALKFTDKGSIIIKVFRDEEYIHVIVKDTGIGIKKEDIPKLFKSFQQLDIVHQRKSGGTGLGLAICQEIIIKHKGKIWLESQLDNGTEVNFLLPISYMGEYDEK